MVPIRDSLKGRLPFAFVHPRSEVPSERLFKEVQRKVRGEIGGIASLGGMIQGSRIIPKTRSGKTLRRIMRQLLENAVDGNFDSAVELPTTIEDAEVVDNARGRIREYFELAGKDLQKSGEARGKI